MSIDTDRERLVQGHNLEWIRCDLKMTDMITVVRWDLENLRQDSFILGGLIPADLVEEILSGEHISDVIENVWPEPAAYAPPGESQIKYFRWGVDENMYGSEPLVIGHQFGKMRDNYFEISEEFRLFHNLYQDRKTDTYIKIDDVGNEETVAIVTHDEVQIRLKEIQQFLAVKEMSLSLLFEFNEYSEYSLHELGLSEIRHRELKREGLICWVYDRLNTPEREFPSDSRLRGRRLIVPLPKSKSGFGDFADEPEQYDEFIVDVDDNGDELCYAGNPHEFGDYPSEDSETTSELSVMSSCSEPSKETLEQNFRKLEAVCDECLGWRIFQSTKLGSEDPFRSLSVPGPDDKHGFKIFISDLAILLIESLDKKRLKGLIPRGKRNRRKDEISRLDDALNSCGIIEIENYVSFLKCLWKLRNTYSKAHVENTDDDRYKCAAAYFDLENLNYQEGSANILGEAVAFLDFLISVVQSGKLGDKNNRSC